MTGSSSRLAQTWQRSTTTPPPVFAAPAGGDFIATSWPLLGMLVVPAHRRREPIVERNARAEAERSELRDVGAAPARRASRCRAGHELHVTADALPDPNREIADARLDVGPHVVDRQMFGSLRDAQQSADGVIDVDEGTRVAAGAP